MTISRIVPLLLACIVLSACGQPEDPARVELRARLKQSAQLSSEELARVLDEVGRTVADKPIRFKQDTVTGDLDQEQRAAVLGMLTERAGVFDEGLRTDGAISSRVLNGPDKSLNAEYTATRRLLIDVDTFVPRRFEFSHEVPGIGDYAFDLVIAP